MSQSTDDELLAGFIAVAREAAAMGPKAFREWVENPEKYLRPGRKYELPIDSILRSLQPQEAEKVASIVEFFSHRSVQYFIKALEDGRAGYTFALTMQHETSSKSLSLINDEQDRNLQGLL